MKNTYSATIKISSAEQLAAFIDSVGPLVESVVITTTPVDRAEAIHKMHPPAKKAAPTKVRASKVNDAILATLQQHGEASVKELKEALERVHLSAGSLSTGIAALTKSGQIERVREGVYGLTGGIQQAAE
jgi:DNA-binding transcriptional ArsR family regulator